MGADRRYETNCVRSDGWIVACGRFNNEKTFKFAHVVTLLGVQALAKIDVLETFVEDKFCLQNLSRFSTDFGWLLKDFEVKAGKLAILPWMSCQYIENILMNKKLFMYMIFAYIF